MNDWREGWNEHPLMREVVARWHAERPDRTHTDEAEACPLCGEGVLPANMSMEARMAGYVTVVVDEDTDDIIDVVDGDASAALALFSAVWPTTVDGEAAQHAAYQYVRAYLARNGFAPVTYVRVGLDYSQLYEGETPKP